MKIQVTQKDINKGECQNPYKCAISLAIKRALGIIYVKTSDQQIWLRKKGCFNIIKVPTPEIARNFIINFDRQKIKYIHPFYFDLEIDEEDVHSMIELVFFSSLHFHIEITTRRD